MDLGWRKYYKIGEEGKFYIQEKVVVIFFWKISNSCQGL